jgi:hypothetical protein
VSRGHGKNKLLQVWLSKEDYDKLEVFLDKFSAGDTDAERRKNFFHWLAQQTENLDQTILALRLKEAEDKRKAQEFHCLRGVVADWQLKKPDLREAFCSACRQRHSRDYEICQRRRKP